MNRPIALIDSGIGGLTVLQNVMELLPNENYIYLADNAFFPYGIKSFDEIKNRLRVIWEYFLMLDVKAFVIACNTASLHVDAVRHISNIPVIDVISPTCDRVIKVTKSKKVCLLATDATVRYSRYQQILRSSGVEVLPVGCSCFVPLAESGNVDSLSTYNVIQNKLLPILSSSFDTVILGCTHFGLLKGAIQSVLGDKIYVECGHPTALKLRDVLHSRRILSSKNGGNLSVVSTGSLSTVLQASKALAFDVADAKTVLL